MTATNNWILLSYQICSEQEITCLQSIAPVCSKPWSLLPLLKFAAALHSYQHHEYPELKPRSFFILLNWKPPLFPLATSSTMWEKVLPFIRIQFHVFTLHAAVPFSTVRTATPAYFWLFIIWLCLTRLCSTIRSIFILFFFFSWTVTVGCCVLSTNLTHAGEKYGKIFSIYLLKRI